MIDSPTTPKFKSVAPYFMTADLSVSVDYYHEVLGFNRADLLGDPPIFAMPARDGFIIMLKQAEVDSRVYTNKDQQGTWDAYIWVDDVAALYSEYQGNGAIMEYELRVQAEHGMKEFAVRDPDDHVIAFGQNYTP